jgi:hypothetical protein
VTGGAQRPTASAAPAAFQLALACVTIAAGGVLLGLQVDGTGAWVGTGYASLGTGALVAVVTSLLQAVRAGRVPRDLVSALSAVAGFCGLAFVVAGVLAPGGPWMFFELFVLFWLLARRRTRSDASGPEVTGPSLFLLTLMLLFRLWVTYQGSEHRWQVMSVPLPGLGALPLPFLEPIRRVDLGSFRPEELGFPPTGLDFPLTLLLWAAGFALCASGLWWRVNAAREHENDRIQAVIETLPPLLANLVQKLLPEEHWEGLGLHGLGERPLQKRIEGLVRERLAAAGEFHTALRSLGALPPASGAFAGEIDGALRTYLPPALPPPGGSNRPGDDLQ